MNGEKRLKRRVGAILPFLVVTMIASAATAEGDSAYSFGMISDSHWTGPAYYDLGRGVRKNAAEYREKWLNVERRNLFRAAAVCGAEPAVDFYVHTGDMIDGRCGSLERQIAQLKDGWEMTRGAFPADIPFIAANGNHETYDFDAPGTYAYQAYAATVQRYLARELGRTESVERHFSFRHGPDLYLVYNSNVDEYDFFKKTLDENPRARYIFAIGHIPAINPCEGGIEIDSPWAGNFMEDHNRFLRLLQSRNVILLCGDTHRLGMVDYVTGEGRLTELMGVSVYVNGPYRELADSPAQFPIAYTSAFQPGGVESDRQKFLKSGLVRFWGAAGAGFWKIHVSDEVVRADLYTWDRKGVVKSLVLRGKEVDVAPLRLHVRTPLSAGLNRVDVTIDEKDRASLSNACWRAGLPSGWSARPFRPESGVLEVILPNRTFLTREERAIRLYATDRASGRLLANDDRHFLHQETFRLEASPVQDPLFIPFIRRSTGAGTDQRALALSWPLASALRETSADFADESLLWQRGSENLLEFFFDLKNQKKTRIDGDTVQLVVLRIGPSVDPAPGEVLFRALVIRDGGRTKSWVTLKGDCRGPRIPWSLVAPTSEKDYVPAPGRATIGMDAFFGDIPLMGANEKNHADPSTWACVDVDFVPAASLP